VKPSKWYNYGVEWCPSSDERVRLFGLLYETNARLARQLGDALEESCALPLAWFDVLLQLHRAQDRRLRMSDLASATVHTSGGTTRLVDRISEMGFVQRAHCPKDRRAIYVEITPEGEAKLIEALGTHVEQVGRRVTDRLSANEQAELSRLLSKLDVS
jgi:DNA-binding MarR family transcriptional regulator